MWDRIAADASHDDLNMHNYYLIEASDGSSITISANHYLHGSSDANAACCSSTTLVTPDALAVGNKIWTATTQNGSSVIDGELKAVSIIGVSQVMREGAYNFLLEQAGSSSFHSIVAGGVVASSFTTEWRLINSFGFDVADKLRDDLRELSLLASDRGQTYSSRNETLMSVLEQVEDVTADCVERHMANCTEADLELAFDQISQEAFPLLGSELVEDAAQLVELLVAKHSAAATAFIPTAARRLVASVTRRLAKVILATTDASTQARLATVYVAVAAKEARHVAARVCEVDPTCAADMKLHLLQSRQSAAWTPPMIVLVALAAACTSLLVSVLAVLVCLFRRRQKRGKINAGSSPAQTAPAAVEVVSPMELAEEKI